MKLNKSTVAKAGLEFNMPPEQVFRLPEKVLQFGTGVLLRALPDFYIDKANKQNVFNGRVVVVKSTGDDVHEFTEQDCLYTHCIKGITGNTNIEEYIINAAISKVISAKNNWQKVLQYAESKHMQIIISNTTEVGIALQEDDDIYAMPPASFPAKLLAFLYKRYQCFNADEESGMIIIPTELIVDNGNTLKAILLQLAVIHKLDKKFTNWLVNANEFCNSLVDKIVPGALKEQDKNALQKLSGYTDDLAIMSEPYNLWAIESSFEKTKEKLSFHTTDNNVIITSNIDKYRELKLRLLNGTHTFNCGLCYLAGFNFVTEAMQQNFMHTFIKDLMLNEIVPCVVSNNITEAEASSFAEKVLGRFSNPFIEHKWLSITMQFSAKMKMRNVPLLMQWYKHNNNVPVRMAAGFAAYILFVKPVDKKQDKFYGISNEKIYLIQDDKAADFYNLWQQNNADTIVQKVLGDKNLWGYDLTLFNNFKDAVTAYLHAFMNGNFSEVIHTINNDKP